MRKLFVFFMVSFFMVQSIHAANVWKTAKVVRSGPAPSNFTFIINSDAAGASTCKRAFRLNSNNPSYKIYIASLMNATNGDKNIMIQYNNSLSECFSEVLQFQVIE